MTGPDDETPGIRPVEPTDRPIGAADIHRRAGTRPATADEVAAFHEDCDVFELDDEG